MSRTATLIVLASLVVATAFAASPTTQPNDREWGQLSTDYQWIETLRKAQPLPPANASRKQMLELVLQNQKKLEPAYVPFMDKVREYYDGTHDRRAGQVLARERTIMGDEHMQYWSRYDKAR